MAPGRSGLMNGSDVDHLCYLGLSAVVGYMCDAQPVTQSPNYRRAGSAQLELPVTSLPGVSAA